MVKSCEILVAYSLPKRIHKSLELQAAAGFFKSPVTASPANLSTTVDFWDVFIGTHLEILILMGDFMVIIDSYHMTLWDFHSASGETLAIPLLRCRCIQVAHNPDTLQSRNATWGQNCGPKSMALEGHTYDFAKNPDRFLVYNVSSPA